MKSLQFDVKMFSLVCPENLLRRFLRGGGNSFGSAPLPLGEATQVGLSLVSLPGGQANPMVNQLGLNLHRRTDTRGEGNGVPRAQSGNPDRKGN